jgi:hypothetical protein
MPRKRRKLIWFFLFGAVLGWVSKDGTYGPAAVEHAITHQP